MESWADSPSLDPRYAAGVKLSPALPSLRHVAASTPRLSFEDRAVSGPLISLSRETTKSPIRKSADAVQITTKSCFPRASRMARARNPSSAAHDIAYQVVTKRFSEIRAMDLERAPKDYRAFKSHRVNLGSGGKGPGVLTCERDQCKMNHLACELLPSSANHPTPGIFSVCATLVSAIKAKDVDTHNTEPAFLLGGFTAPMLWDRLAESSLKSNAVNSSVLGRKKTQGMPPTATMHERHASDFFVCVRARVVSPQERRTKQRAPPA